MAQLLFKVGRWSYRRRYVVIALWLVVLVGLGGAAITLQKGFNDKFAIPGTPSQDAAELLIKNFPDQKNPLDNAGVNIIFAAPPGHTLSEPKYVQAMDDVIAYLDQHLPDIGDRTRFGNPVTYNPVFQEGIIKQEVDSGLPEDTARRDAQNLSLLSEDGRIGYTTLSLNVPSPTDVTDEHRQAIKDALEIGRTAGLTVEGGGAAFGDPLEIRTTSEMIGLAVAFIVLIFTFGSVIAAGLPLVTAVLGIGIGSVSIVLATRFVFLNNTTPVLAVMLGLAVGIDYALFILARYRTEYKRTSREDAAGLAVGTAGSAVVFAGLTVIIALLALSIVRIPFLTYMGLAAAFTVFVAVCVALTLVPALLGVMGKFAFGLKIPGLAGSKPVHIDEVSDQPRARRSKGRAWVMFVHRYPALVLSVVIVALGLLTMPALRLELALPNDSTSSLSSTQRKSADLITEGFGDGRNSLMLAVVDAAGVDPKAPALEPMVRAQRDIAKQKGEAFDENKAATTAAFTYVAERFATNADVKHAQLVGVNPTGTAAQLMITPYAGPNDPMTTKLLHSLRASQAEVESATGVTIGITGLTPIQRDVTQKLSDALPLYLSIVVGLAFVLLLLIFRSILVPLVAGIGFLLSVGAAFGVTVLFWQEGLWGLVETPGPLISFMPIFLIGVTFGLAMDYQVFLVSRMREHFTHHRGLATPGSRFNAVDESVIEGYTLGSRVVTSAALIMIAVFVAFIDQPLPFIKIFGFALGAGVLFDAFFIRMALVPASMFLMGHSTWWLPRWLDRILPTLDIEGAALEEEWEHKRAAADEEAERKVAQLAARSN
ncbi:MMPL family transporter [Corynebacterium epidermidicanis]|uniref:Putative RND superfamily drug exporter n=1 Tax=Corynebacterium epidermidicanis TaxID=1050174 RepID=A0A0G3GLQ6_9CORY|nr:MMPL family transporter [Corynebacterium epidermidicanis]AKK02116.1 putative RND superfamily drug exporter [Corynebacterium epidermidicanis]